MKIKCPQCHVEFHEEKIKRKACLFCNMILTDPSREFCSRTCRTEYLQRKINKLVLPTIS